MGVGLVQLAADANYTPACNRLLDAGAQWTCRSKGTAFLLLSTTVIWNLFSFYVRRIGHPGPRDRERKG